MSKLVIYSSVNSRDKKDASGAFEPEALGFAEKHGILKKDVIALDCVNILPEKRFRRVLDEVSARDALELFAFFGHGWPSGIQCGVSLNNVSKFVSAMHPADDIKVGLFSCLTAEDDVRDNVTDPKGIGPATDGGLADRLRDELMASGVDSGWVDAHKTGGHTMVNPYVVRFDCDHRSGGEFSPKNIYGKVGGYWIVQPFTALWKKWRIKLNKDDEFRRLFVTLSADDIRRRLLS